MSAERDSDRGHHRRRRHHRSRSGGGGGRHHKHRRRHEAATDQAQPAESPAPARATEPPRWPPFEADQWQGQHPSAPPSGWHGSAGAPPPPPGPAGYPPGAPPGAPFGMHGPPLGWGPAPPVGYEAAPAGPYGSPFGAVPPPPGLDASLLGKGKKGKGRGKGGPPELEGFRGSASPDGLILSNVPEEVNNLDALNRHFRQFGEVLKITCQADQGKAFVQFAAREFVEAASQVPVLNNPDISLAWSLRPVKGKGEKGGSEKGKAKGKDGRNKPAENRTLCCDPEEQRKMDDSRAKRDELASRKAALLSGLTEQMKTIMAKITDESVSEAKRETLRTLLLSLKEKMDSLSSYSMGAAISKDTRPLGTPKKHAPNSLDNRTKTLKLGLPQGISLEGVRDELRKLGAGDDHVVQLDLEPGEDGQPGGDAAIVRFKDRPKAEKVFGQRSELPFSVEWYEPRSLGGGSEQGTPAREQLPEESAPAAEAAPEEAAAERIAAGAASDSAEPVAAASTEQSEEAPAGSAAEPTAAEPAASEPSTEAPVNNAEEASLKADGPEAAAAAAAAPAASEPEEEAAPDFGDGTAEG
eukprot:TRINITY_DN26960_c2_g1_i1.p1 TRINITY_DN26960_c2_g1~~TRINITY_DN26960_c2_g1_i1.p1  ORF type:complete len:601 (+),score=150.36 TRINITY_DN26960_c2_g1_i1:59-1804(+)